MTASMSRPLSGAVRVMQRRAFLTILTLALPLGTACQSAAPTVPTMSLEEANLVTASSGGANYVPPPRTIKDLEGLLHTAADRDARWTADKPIDEGALTPER